MGYPRGVGNVPKTRDDVGVVPAEDGAEVALRVVRDTKVTSHSCPGGIVGFGAVHDYAIQVPHHGATLVFAHFFPASSMIISASAFPPSMRKRAADSPPPKRGRVPAAPGLRNRVVSTLSQTATCECP